jgi:uncharacterized membrane protein YraQ (UPF0718 family)
MTHFIVQRGWLGQRILQSQRVPSVQSRWKFVTNTVFRTIDWRKLKERLVVPLFAQRAAVASVGSGAQSTCCVAATTIDDAQRDIAPSSSTSSHASTTQSFDKQIATSGSGCRAQRRPFSQQLMLETWKATAMVVKFMALAFFLKALITLYVPAEWIAGLLGSGNAYSIVVAAFIGVPLYTSNLAALPMISGLLAQGMDPGAALAFLIAGPMTTLPAMAAVWGLVSRRVFALYVVFALLGALVLGYAYSAVTLL